MEKNVMVFHDTDLKNATSLEDAIAEDVEGESQHHEQAAKAKRQPRDHIVDARLTLIGRPHAAAARHRIALTRREHQEGKYGGRDERQAQQNVVEGLHSPKSIPDEKWRTSSDRTG